MRRLFLPALALLALDLGATALSPATGLSLTADAHAQSVKWTGKIKRIKIRKKRVGTGYKVQVKTTDGGDGTAADAASLAVQVCPSTGCSDSTAGAVLEQDEYVATFDSGLFTFDGSLVPEGEYTLTTELVDGYGKAVGELQAWMLTAKGGEVAVEPATEVKTTPYVAGLDVVADECGNGRLESTVAGSGAADVGGIRWISTDEKGFLAGDDAEKCAEGPCLTGTLAGGAATYNASDVELGAEAVKLAEVKDAAVIVTVTAYDEKGGVLGTTKTEATAKYGDILIDGVPLEFD